MPCQLERDLQANLADLPTACDWDGKKNRPSKAGCWRGYKLHLGVIAGDIPVSAVLTAASLHNEHGGRHVRVRGPVKMAAHLAFGLRVIAAEQMRRMHKNVRRRAIFTTEPLVATAAGGRREGFGKSLNCNIWVKSALERRQKTGLRRSRSM